MDTLTVCLFDDWRSHFHRYRRATFYGCGESRVSNEMRKYTRVLLFCGIILFTLSSTPLLLLWISKEDTSAQEIMKLLEVLGWY